MNLFIDSTQKVFIACLFDNKNKAIYTSKIETKYKVEEIISFFDDVYHFNEIKNIYINLGPGSFTGSRIALLYVRTMAQVNKQIKIFTCNTYDLLNKQIKFKLFHSKKIYISATKNKSYLLKENEFKIVPKKQKEKEINYDKIIKDFNSYLDIFKETSCINLKPIYASEPQIGEIK